MEQFLETHGYYLYLAGGALAAALLLVLVYFVAVAVFTWMAERVRRRISDGVAEAGDNLGAFAADRADAAFSGLSSRLARYAEKRGIGPEEAKQRFFERTESLARIMDRAIEVPLIGGVGLDALIGAALPGLGDAISKSVSAYIIFCALQYGIPKELVAKMVRNSFLDFLIGLMPGLGDFLDVLYKDNGKNVELLRDYLEKRGDLQRRT